MASATSSSNSVASRARAGCRASSSLRITRRSNSRSDSVGRPISATVAHAMNRTNATAAAVHVSSPPKPDSDGGFSSISSSPTGKAAIAAARRIWRSESMGHIQRTPRFTQERGGRRFPLPFNAEERRDMRLKPLLFIAGAAGAAATVMKRRGQGVQDVAKAAPEPVKQAAQSAAETVQRAVQSVTDGGDQPHERYEPPVEAGAQPPV